MSGIKVSDDELQASQTAGYRGPGKQTTLEERQKLDFYDDSLAKYEASLGVAAAGSGSGPKVTVLAVKLTPAGRPPIQLDLTKPFDSKNPIVMKEGTTFVPSLNFKVNHGIVSGLKYLQVAKRLGISQKTEEMVGSYAAQQEPIEKKFNEDDVVRPAHAHR